MSVASISHVGSSVSAAWYGGVLAPNGYIYGIPGTANTVLKIDPATDTVTTFGSVSAVTGITLARNSYFDGVLVGSNIYCVPHDGAINPEPVLVIDTSNDDVLTGDFLRVDIDGAGTGAKGLIVMVTLQPV